MRDESGQLPSAVEDELYLQSQASLVNEGGPLPERQADLRARYKQNMDEGKPPYAGVEIRTLGEVA